MGDRSLRIDGHCHIGTSALSCHLTDRRYTVEDLLWRMDSCGVDMACVSGGGLPSEVKAMNENVRDAVRRYPDRIVGFMRASPWEENLSEEMDYYLGQERFRGIKLHPFQDCFCLLLEPRLGIIFEKAREYRVPVYIHSGSEPWTMPGQVADQALEYPDVTVIMGHSCMNNLYQHLMPSAKRAPNVVLETSVASGVGGLRELGSDRVVFGSDWPTTSMRGQIEKVRASVSTDRELDDVLGGSMARILRL